MTNSDKEFEKIVEGLRNDAEFRDATKVGPAQRASLAYHKFGSSLGNSHNADTSKNNNATKRGLLGTRKHFGTFEPVSASSGSFWQRLVLKCETRWENRRNSNFA